MTFEERKAQVRSYLGKKVHMGVDRPIGYVHHKEKYDLTYPINYGYIPGVLGGDGEELDVYLLGVETPVTEYDAKVIGIVHRKNDIEDKLIAAPDGLSFTREEMANAVRFQEQYYDSVIETADGFGTRRVLFIDACARKDSRTRRFAKALLDKFCADANTVKLYEEDIRPLDGATVEKRSALNSICDHSDPMFRFARAFAEAETIMIAAPFWDNSFPAVLKTYIENICVNGLTFKYTEQGVPMGLCRAKTLYYVTTAGGVIFDRSFGAGYIESLCKGMFGIPEFREYTAENLDIYGSDPEQILASAIEKAEVY